VNIKEFRKLYEKVKLEESNPKPEKIIQELEDLKAFVDETYRMWKEGTKLVELDDAFEDIKMEIQNIINHNTSKK
jgi:hypothetical protein